jgi:hypothetical protein
VSLSFDLLEFRKKHPDARPRISTPRGKARVEGVSNGSLDLAIVTHDEPSIVEIARRPLKIEPLVTCRLCLVCASDSKWASKLRSSRERATKMTLASRDDWIGLARCRPGQ